MRDSARRGQCRLQNPTSPRFQRVAIKIALAGGCAQLPPQVRVPGKTAQGLHESIDIARRTVAKYLKILNIPTSRQRREY